MESSAALIKGRWYRLSLTEFWSRWALGRLLDKISNEYVTSI
jgi:hypothetical protein